MDNIAVNMDYLTISFLKKINFLIPDGTYIDTFQRNASTSGQIPNVIIAF